MLSTLADNDVFKNEIQNSDGSVEEMIKIGITRILEIPSDTVNIKQTSSISDVNLRSLKGKTQIISWKLLARSQRTQTTVHVGTVF